MKLGFDNDKYLKMQSDHIRERINQFGDKLYLEFGGKLFDDFHASRVLPGFAPDSKLRMLLQLADQAEIVIAISAADIANNYCKECRKSASRKYRKTEKRTLARDDREPYPVITSTKDPDLRQKLILSALQIVRASIKRKKQKLCEVEAELND